jgi:hypothetical protein
MYAYVNQYIDVILFNDYLRNKKLLFFKEK